MLFETKHPVEFELIAPPPDLREQVNIFYAMRSGAERIEDVMPAYSGQVYAIFEGTFELHFESGTQRAPAPVFLNAPLLQATRLSVLGPFRCVGASLTHRGWAELVGEPVDAVHHRMIPSHDALSHELADRLVGIGQADPDDPAQTTEALSQVFREAITPIKLAHATFIDETMSWLSKEFNPPVEALFDELAISRRQAQRLSNRFFGVPPRQLLKRVRAMRAATLLSQPDLPATVRDEISLAYFDQSHLINDLRRYTGRTPTILEEGDLVVRTFDPAAHGPPGKYARDALEKE